ncbi:MAG: helix-turn-helix domain-containing protein [Bacillales bacterium]|nr:helix-turn-helix domain-containing protein [Bacillales bacterium]
MNLFQAVLLYCLEKIHGERTVYSIFHILKGKKSLQSIQDVHFYELTKWFSTVPYMNRSDFEKEIQQLCDQQWCHLENGGRAFLLPKGKSELEEFWTKNPALPYLDGWPLHSMASVFWKRLNLLVQTVSHLIHQESIFYPAERNEQVQNWVKKWLLGRKVNRADTGVQLYRELYELLQSEKTEDPRLLVFRLSGYERIGKTAAQTAKQLGMDEPEYWLRFTHLIHFMIHSALHHPKKFPILYEMLLDLHQPVILTKSARKTYDLFQRGLSVEQIANVRRLKRNTIEDHLVEIALNVPDFSIDSFIEKDEFEAFKKAAKTLTSKKLKDIKAILPHLSYFQIRLVLAKYGRIVNQHGT